MQLHIFFTPADVAAINAPVDDIYIVIDVIRATTSLATMFDRGANRVFCANTLEQTEQAAYIYPERLLCGERKALPLPGFNYGNSPAQFARTDLTGQDMILTTTNGSRAFYACPEKSLCLAGCFYNARAAVTQAITLAQRQGSDLAIVCAGESGYFALDDATCAGYLALEIQRQHTQVQVHESAHAAIALYQTYMPPKLLDYSHSTQQVMAAGLREDLDFCIKIDASTSVPVVVGREQDTGLLILERG